MPRLFERTGPFIIRNGKKDTGKEFDLLGKAGNKILAFSLYKTFDYFYI